MNLCVAFLGFAVAALPAGAGESPKSIQSELSALEARVAKLEGQIVSADLVGTYAFSGFQTEMNANVPSIASYVISATVELAADGTFSFGEPGSEVGYQLLLGAQPSVQPWQPPFGEGFTSTWTYADGTVDVGGFLLLNVAAGGRVLVGVNANSGSNTVLFILTRL